MVVIFDLDDTLYEEFTYVKSGFRAVADYAQKTWGWNSNDSLAELLNLLEEDGRGAVFDTWLTRKEVYSKSRVRKCLMVYRNHSPQISLYQEAEQLLDGLSPTTSTYLVTDGNKLVQARKVAALSLDERLSGIFITHRFGTKAAKPSTYCFEKIRQREKVSWNQLVYVGDNPSKDFVSLKPLGAETVRVRTGSYKNVDADPTYDADYSIDNLGYFFDLGLDV